MADGIGMDLDQARRLEDTTALVDVFEDREDLVLRQVGAVQRGTLAFGEPGAAGAAIEQAILPGLAESAGDGEISALRRPKSGLGKSGNKFETGRPWLEVRARKRSENTT